MRVRPCETRATWDAVVDSFDEAVFFHTWDWLDLQEQLLGVHVERLVVEHRGDVVGLVPVLRASRRSVISFFPPDPLQGPLVPADLLAALPGALRRRQWRSGMLVHRFDVGPLLAGEWRAPLERASCAVRARPTVVIDLAGPGSPEALRAGYSRNHRRALNRAEREGTSARIAAPGEVAALLAELVRESSGRHGRDFPYHPDLGQIVERWARDRDDVGLFAVDVQDQLAGVIVALGGRPTALGWLGGSLEQFRDTDANVVLHHAMLVWALERGHDRIDLCAGASYEGGRRFKTAFGGEVRDGLHVECGAVLSRAFAAVRRRQVPDTPTADSVRT